MGEPETAWPTEEKWNLGHGKPGKAMTCRRKMKSRSWETRKGHDLQEKNEIQVMVELERSWPTGEKWNPGHGGTGKVMTYRRKMKSRSWWNWKGHDLQEKNEIQAMVELERPWPTGEKWNSDHRENGNSMIRRFCLFANVVHKINHARRNFTFTGKITPRVNLLKGYLRKIEKAEIPDMKIMHAF